MARPAPSTVRRYQRRPEFVDAVQSTLPVRVAACERRPIDPGDWLILRDGQCVEVLTDAEFRALYVEADSQGA